MNKKLFLELKNEQEFWHFQLKVFVGRPRFAEILRDYVLIISKFSCCMIKLPQVILNEKRYICNLKISSQWYKNFYTIQTNRCNRTYYVEFLLFSNHIVDEKKWKGYVRLLTRIRSKFCAVKMLQGIFFQCAKNGYNYAPF